MSSHLYITARRPTCELAKPTSSRPHSPIYILNNDVLLEILKFYQLGIKDEDEDENVRIVRRWDRQRWWYKLAQVSRAWRHVILASPAQLNLHLLCTYGVPVADMLTHSPPFPLIIFYNDSDREMTAEDNEGALLAISHRDRVRRISLCMPAPNLEKFMAVMDEDFPVLERICLGSKLEDSRRLIFSTTFQAPNLSHIWTDSIGFPLRTNAGGLVNLELIDIPASTYFPASYILALVSLMPHLETLVIHFSSPPPMPDVADVGRRLSDTWVVAHPLIHLYMLSFRGVSAYLESLVARISAPALSVLDIRLFNQLIFTVPRLLQFMQTSENLSYRSLKLTFNKDFVGLMLYNRTPWQHPLPVRLRIMCRHLDWQVSSAIQILCALSPVLSVLEKLTLDHVEDTQWLDEVGRTHWRGLLRPLIGIKSLCVSSTLVRGLSHSLCSEGGEMPLELFPNLRELQYFGGQNAQAWSALNLFINERKAAGHAVILVSYS
jgi:hypothetical protein